MIYGIGRNYASHAKELGNSVPQGSPMVFFKPDGAIVLSGHKVKLPAFSKNVHYEVELCFKFGPKLEISEICVGNDLTARDKQKEAQEKGMPWSLAKGFQQSCGLGNWVSAQGVNLQNLELSLTQNGKQVQHGFTRDMVYDCKTLQNYLTQNFPIQPGDIVMTGTPEGVGPIQSGDVLVAEIKGLSHGEWQYE